MNITEAAQTDPTYLREESEMSVSDDDMLWYLNEFYADPAEHEDRCIRCGQPVHGISRNCLVWR